MKPMMTKILAWSAASVLAFSGAPLFANALTTEMVKSASPESLPDGAQVTGLEIQPQKISLTGKYEAVQVIVTAKLASGASADVTRIGAFRMDSDGPVIDIGATGKAKPIRNGVGVLNFSVAGQQASVPVEVSGIT